MGVKLVQIAFQDGFLAEEAAWQAVILILKWIGGYRGIGLVEVIWNAVAVILDRRFTAAITYHNSPHKFQTGCSTGTATLEVYLVHKVVDLREAVLHAILLDLYKAYYNLDRSRCLDILKGYGVGPRSLRLLHRYW